MRNIITTLLLCVICATGTYAGKKASIELWPADRRSSKAAYLIGNEYNHLLFSIETRPSGFSSHRFTLPDPLTEKVIFTVDYPSELKHVQTVGHGSTELRTEEEAVTHSGKSYKRYKITLDSDGPSGLKAQLLRAGYCYHICSWVIPPRKLNAKIYWKLLYGKTVLAKGNNFVKVVGKIDPASKLPKRFFTSFSGGANTYLFPNNDFNSLAKLYKKLGVNYLDISYSNKPLSPIYMSFIKAMRLEGIKLNALPADSFLEYWFFLPKKNPEKGLVWGTTEAAKLIKERGRTSFAAIAEYFDGFVFDYEPENPRIHPGYDDQPTIKAFAAKFGIKENLTTDLLKGKYHEQYISFRQELLLQPIEAVRKMTESVKPVSLFLEQGSGVDSHLDYKTYDKFVTFQCPMIYTASQLDFYMRTSRLVNYLKNKKVVPDTTFGYIDSTSCIMIRETPEEAKLEVVSAAAAGAAGFRHWPGLRYLDEGMLWGIYQGLKIVAFAEPFYFDGKETNVIKVAGMPYVSKKITVGTQTIEIDQPDWKTSLCIRVHKLNDKFLITLLNFNINEDAFVKISGDVLKNKTIYNPESGKYITMNSENNAIVKVDKSSASIWIVSEKKSEECTKLMHSKTLSKQFKVKCALYKRNNSDSVKIGTKGKINIKYDSIKVKGKKVIALIVKTPKQELSFIMSGGRLFDWTVKGEKIVSGKSIANDGLGMDLLWLPASAKRSGDEIQEMKLTHCNNNGTVATIVFTGGFNKGFPGLKIEKTYQINAQDASINVSVKITNTTPSPVKFSYWSHNIMNFKNQQIMFLKKGKIVVKTTKGDSIFPARKLNEKERNLVLMREKIVDHIGPVYAELIPDSDLALVVNLPLNFLNVYRHNRGSEWMSRPIQLATGKSSHINFSFSVVKKDAAKNLSDFKLRKIKQLMTKEGKSNNLLRYTFQDNDHDGFPDGFDKNFIDTANVSYARGTQNTPHPVLILKGSENKLNRLLLKKSLILKPNRKYLFAVQIKIKNMTYTGEWYNNTRGFWVYLYSNGRPHKWAAITGQGESNGWITVMLPFNTFGEKNQPFTQPKFFFWMNKTKGDFYVKNPILIKRDSSSKLETHFITDKGMKIPGSRFNM